MSPLRLQGDRRLEPSVAMPRVEHEVSAGKRWVIARLVITALVLAWNG